MVPFLVGRDTDMASYESVRPVPVLSQRLSDVVAGIRWWKSPKLPMRTFRGPDDAIRDEFK